MTNNQLKTTLKRGRNTIGFATRSSLEHILDIHSSVFQFEDNSKSLFTVPAHLICSLIEANMDVGRVRTNQSIDRVVVKLHCPFIIGLSIEGLDARVLVCGLEPFDGFMKLKTCFPQACNNCKFIYINIVEVILRNLLIIGQLKHSRMTVKDTTASAYFGGGEVCVQFKEGSLRLQTAAPAGLSDRPLPAGKLSGHELQLCHLM